MLSLILSVALAQSPAQAPDAALLVAELVKVRAEASALRSRAEAAEARAGLALGQLQELRRRVAPVAAPTPAPIARPVVYYTPAVSYAPPSYGYGYGAMTGGCSGGRCR